MSVAALVIPMAGSADDARHRMMEKIGPEMEKSGLEAVGHDILLAIYDRAGQKTAGGILIPGNNREDQFQGKVGLVVSLGPMCSGPEFEDWFGDRPPKIGDWYGLNTRDGMSLLLGEAMFRAVEWKYLRFRVSAPDRVL